MNEDSTPARRVAVKCERHGLHYNPATQTGCALCRREAAGGAAAAEAARGPAGGTALVRAWLLAAVLVFATAVALDLLGAALLHAPPPFAGRAESPSTGAPDELQTR